MRKPTLGRFRHLVMLVPLGAAVGAVGGLIWQDVLFGMAVGVGFGVVYGLLFALRNVK